MKSRLSTTSSQSKQISIFAALKNWKSLEKKQQTAKLQMKKIFTSPVIIDLSQLDTDSESDTEVRNADTEVRNADNPNLEDSKCSKDFPFMIGVNKPNASSTPIKSQSCIQSDDESSCSTFILEDSQEEEETINLGNTVRTSTTGKIIIKQDIMIPSSDGMNNSPAPKDSEVTETVIHGQSVEINEKSKMEKSESNQDKRKVNKTVTAVDHARTPEIIPEKSSTENKSIIENCSKKIDDVPSKTVASHSEKSIQNYKNRNVKQSEESEQQLNDNMTRNEEENSKLQDKNKQGKEKKVVKSLPLAAMSPTKRKANNIPPSEKISPKGSKKESKTMKKYLNVLNILFSTVYNSPHLKTFVETEKSLLNMINSADPKYFFVCLKLYTWLPKWYNIFSFCEKIMVGLEDKEIIDLYEFLKHNEIVDTDINKDNLQNLLNNLSKQQLKSICQKFRLLKAFKSNPHVTKETLLERLYKYCNTQSTLLHKSSKDLLRKEVKCQMGYCVKLNDRFREAFNNAYILGTFTNPAFFDINDFFNNMLNHKILFPDYKVEEYRVFHSKEEFKSYVYARKMRKCIEDALKYKNHMEMLNISQEVFQALKKFKESNTNKDLDRHRDVPHLKKFTAESECISCLSKLAEPLTPKYPEHVVEWLEYLMEQFPTSHRLGDWCYQLTWLYMRYLQPDKYEEAAKLIIKMLHSDLDNLSDVQTHQIAKRGEQLKKGRKNKINQLYHDTIVELLPETIKLEDFPSIVVDATAMRSSDAGRKRNYAVHDSDGNKCYMSVENIALKYYKEEYGFTDGQHCENSLIKATFTLFFWDIIYNPEKEIAGTFLSNIQNVPLDMYSTLFYENRRDAIDRRLKEIESDWRDEELLKFLKHSWDSHSHESGFCEPGLVIKEAEFLEILVNCIGRKVLAKIYERLVKNVRLYCSGLPDLLVWNVDNKKSKFVEVKGENDKLSIKQKLWLKYLKSIGADIEICHVHSIGSKRKITKKVDKKLKLEKKKDENEKADGNKKQLDEKSGTVDEGKSKIVKGKRKLDETSGKVVRKRGKVDKKTKNNAETEESPLLDASQYCETVLEVNIERASTSSCQTKKNDTAGKNKTNSAMVCKPSTSRIVTDSGILDEDSHFMPD